MSLRIEKNIGGKTYVYETGKIARQATGAVTFSCGDTVVFTAAVFDKPRFEDAAPDVLPLTVDYRERTSAAGKFPGGFIKREGRPTTKEILTMRLIDRPLRPLFTKYFSNELVLTSMVLSADRDYDPDVFAVNAGSMALTLTGMPNYTGPVSCVRIGRIGNGGFILNPSYEETHKGSLDLIIAGTEEAIVMAEGSAREISEGDLLEAIKFAHGYIKEFVRFQKEMLAKWDPKKLVLTYPEKDEKIYAELKSKYTEELKKRILTKIKKEREGKVKELRDQIIETYCKREVEPLAKSAVNFAFNELESELVRAFLLGGVRVDGRKLDEIRPISIEVGLLPAVHGSALFTRGETQALAVATLGTSSDEQIVDGLGEEYSKKFMLHYNFPSFCVGEARPPRTPSRREIGHGDLAERAIEMALPEDGAFPYTIRLISDVMESNGSSSMATVCGGSLCLMDAGVPIQKPVSGIAMGLVMEGNNYKILSDILGLEDANGDMDFKVAGTSAGITGFQLDVKLATGIPYEVLQKALEQAKIGRSSILATMLAAMPAARAEVSPNAPRLLRIRIKPEKIGAVIGTGGKVIKKIEEDTGATVEIDDSGEITLSGRNLEIVNKAREIIEAIVEGPRVGKIYDGKVVSLKEFGAFVELAGLGKEGLLHVSEVASTFVKNVDEHLKVGQEVKVKVIGVDDMTGKIRLSKKQADLELAQQPPQA